MGIFEVICQRVFWSRKAALMVVYAHCFCHYLHFGSIHLVNTLASLCSKCFRVGSEQKTTKEPRGTVFSVLAAWKIEWESKNERGGKERLISTPSQLFYLPHFLHSLWLSSLILCSETSRKRLLRRLYTCTLFVMVFVCLGTTATTLAHTTNNTDTYY